MSAPFDLRALAREVIDQDTSEDLAQITKELRRRIPAKLTGEALDQALTVFVHDTLRKPWSGQRRDSDSPRPSPKVTGIREHWRRQLETVIYSVDGAGTVRRIGDMSHADLIFAADGLTEQARQHQAKAAWLGRIADKVAEHGAARVRDLPGTCLASLFGKQAA